MPTASAIRQPRSIRANSDIQATMGMPSPEHIRATRAIAFASTSPLVDCHSCTTRQPMMPAVREPRNPTWKAQSVSSPAPFQASTSAQITAIQAVAPARRSNACRATLPTISVRIGINIQTW